MINQIFKNILRFVLLIIMQVLLVKNIELGRFINPFIYVLFIIMLPFETPNLLLLLLSFILGLTVDMFYDTMGMHAAACITMAFIRPNIYKAFAPREGYEVGLEPSIKYMGRTWFLSCAGVLIFAHHLVLFYIEVFRFSEFFSTFFRVVMSSIFSIGLCMLILYITQKRRNES